MELAEMRMLRWMCGHTMLDQIRNKVFREKLGVTSISGRGGNLDPKPFKWVNLGCF
ncbi:hypothetical protein HanOQP8_Chr15g0561111 [Helianthus annuus]|nr:hypothetical protein HanHA89_Chr15g0601931 [Helianthus annuus]KAJ0651451.1 hypothetical protein HanOQP8_Chr15g0561111 [Helianthus annuus]